MCVVLCVHAERGWRMWPVSKASNAGGAAAAQGTSGTLLQLQPALPLPLPAVWVLWVLRTTTRTSCMHLTSPAPPRLTAHPRRGLQAAIRTRRRTRTASLGPPSWTRVGAAAAAPAPRQRRCWTRRRRTTRATSRRVSRAGGRARGRGQRVRCQLASRWPLGRVCKAVGLVGWLIGWQGSSSSGHHLAPTSTYREYARVKVPRPLLRHNSPVFGARGIMPLSHMHAIPLATPCSSCARMRTRARA